MRSSDMQSNEGQSIYETETGYTWETWSTEDRTLEDQTYTGREAGITGFSSLYEYLCNGIAGDHSQKERWLRIVGGILEQLISDSEDQLLENRETIDRLHRQNQKLQQRISNLRDIKKLTED